MKDIYKRVKTPDNWYPTYQDGTVEVGLVRLVRYTDLRPNMPNWRVCVWGADDFGMERDFATRAEAQPCYDRIKDGITIEELSRRDFRRA